MAEWLGRHGFSIKDKVFFEIGTGHKPIVPIGFYLLGAKSVITMDLNRRLDLDVLRESLACMASNSDRIHKMYELIKDPISFGKRLSVLDEFKDDPEEFLRVSQIKYIAPGDAASTNLNDQSIDCCFSVTTLEHIPPKDLGEINKEMYCILKGTGVIIHFIDLSDHFSHRNDTLSPINFLRYSEIDWQRIAGNEFAYCNRLRVSDYLKLFEESNFNVIDQAQKHEYEVVQDIEKGLVLDKNFINYPESDITSRELKVILAKR